jgi:plasmid maintenance system killer protein
MGYILKWEDESVRDKYRALGNGRSEDKELSKSIKRKLDILKYNPYRGDNIEKKKIPESYSKKYHLNNLLKININKNWRLLYHVKSLDR